MRRTFVAALLAGCAPTVAHEDERDDTSASGDASGGSSTGSTTSTTTFVPPDESSGSTEPDVGNASASGFIGPAPDAYPSECDLWEQDCPRGEKCMPFANDGGTTWNAARCSPIVPDPGAPGDACTVEGNPMSGVDTCDIRTMCWSVDPTTLEGVCVAFCMGTENNPICADPSTECSINSDAILLLCLPICDPLAQDCPPGNGCWAVDDGFTCAPDASGEDGAFGDACAALNLCDPGLHCADAAGVPGCRAQQCCTPYCDVNAPECPDAAQVCVPWLDPGEGPPTHAHVGVCMVPE